MQHLDEGTIHAWLDGALTPEEAAQADAHVKGCPQCQAAVAEARGFIAASSRILTALDNAPRGVIPIAPRQRVQPWVWRVAATVLVVATGTVLLVKERGSESRSATNTTTESTAPPAQPAFAAPVIIPSRPMAADSAARPRTEGQPATASAATRPSAPPGRVGGVAEAPLRATAQQDLSTNSVETRAPAAARRADAPSELKSAVVAPVVGASVPAAAPAATALRQTFGAVGGVNTVTLPREVGTRHLPGRTQTFYEIAPGDTVVLEQQLPMQLQGRVITGAVAGRSQAQLARPAEKSAAASVEAQAKAEPAPPPAPAMQDAQISDRHSISWLDPSTRQVIVLSGHHSQEELERIRDQIQRMRAAQSKKNPE